MAINKYPHIKRIFSIVLIIIGAVLIFFAPENAWIGVVFFTLGLGIEIVGLVLRHHKQRNQT